MLLKLFGPSADPEKLPLPAADEALLARLDKINAFLPIAEKNRDSKFAQQLLTLDHFYQSYARSDIREHLRRRDKNSYYIFVAQSAAPSGDTEKRLAALRIEMKALSKFSTPKKLFMMRLEAGENFIASIEKPSLGRRILDRLYL